MSGATRAAASASPCSDTLYFDGQCPLCAAEIAELRKQRGEGLNIVDIHEVDVQDDTLPSQEHLLRTLHLRRRDGSWLQGADANVAAWEGTPRWRRLRLLRWPLLRHAVDAVYALWARWRYRRLYGK